MADEAVNPAPEEAREEVREHRWGASGYTGDWVRAADIGLGERARWIDDDGVRPAGGGERAAQSPDQERGTDHPGT